MGSPTGVRRAYAGWLVVLVAAAGLAALTLRPAVAQDDELADPTAFAQTSYQSNCASCHGPSGGGGTVPGTGLPGPSLVGRDDVTAAYVDLVLRTGRMPPAGDPFDNRARQVFYDDAERRAMVEWMTEALDLDDDIPGLAEDLREGDVAAGLESFALHCAHCHGNTGAGGTAGQGAWTPRVNNLEPLGVAEAVRVGPFEMPAFGQDLLDQADVNDIITYLEAVDEEPGTPVFGLVELNPVFASGFVGLLALLLLGSLLFIGGRPVPFESEHGGEDSDPLPSPVASDDIAPTPADPGRRDPDDPDDSQEML
ncbi:MAG TPA: cytochrome c [Euzebya sp.]|nr:cytochrome c [Euzebya sp.]